MTRLYSLFLATVIARLTYALPVSSHDPQLIGRVNPQTNELTWPATGVAFEFDGTGATINFAQVTGTNSIDLVIDNAAPIVITEFSDTEISTPALSSGHHSVRFYKRSEALFGSLFFSNVTVNGTLKDTSAPSRHIEFIGDSITAGYGEAGTLPCTVSAANEDAYDTYGALTARNLSVDYSLVAWSGIGVVRNTVSANNDTSPVMPERWTRYGANDADNSYTFPPAATPQVVVINLGTNDYAYLLYDANGNAYNGRDPLNNTIFGEAYLSFVKTVRSKYPDAYYFLTSSPMLSDYWPSTADAQHTSQLGAIEQVVSQLNSSKVQAVDFPTEVIGEGLTGCDDHPGPVGQQAMADILIPAIRNKLRW